MTRRLQGIGIGKAKRGKGPRTKRQVIRRRARHAEQHYTPEPVHLRVGGGS